MEDTEQFLCSHDRANTFTGETIGRITALLGMFDAMSNLSKKKTKTIKAE